MDKKIDGALELARAETSALLHTARRMLQHLEAAEAASDRQAYALAMLEADIHASVLASEIEETRKVATQAGIGVGDDDVDLEEEEDPLEDEDEDEEDDDPEEGFELPAEPEPMQLRERP